MDKAAEMRKEAIFSRLRSLRVLNPFNNTTTKQVMQTALGLGSAGLVLGGASSAAEGLADAAATPIKRHLGYKRMVRDNPWIKDEDQDTVKKFYRTLFNFSPTVAMDPMASGSFMKKQLEFKDIGIQHNDIHTLSNIEKAVRDTKADRLIFNSFRPSAAADVGALKKYPLDDGGSGAGN